jgi:hypothetical protein
VIPNAGHLSNLENSKAFGDALEAFLAELDRHPVVPAKAGTQ